MVTLTTLAWILVSSIVTAIITTIWSDLVWPPIRDRHLPSSIDKWKRISTEQKVKLNRLKVHFRGALHRILW